MQYQTTMVLEVQTCISCGVAFGVPYDYDKERQKDKKSFYCPNGHPQCYGGVPMDKLKQQLAEAEKKATAATLKAELYHGYYNAEQSDHEHTRNRLRATKGVLTKTKKRVANGVCPVCNRSFQSLHRHMKGQHPDYVGEEHNHEEGA